MVVYLLIIFVERLHLLEYLIRDFMQRSHLKWCYRDFNIVKFSDYWLELWIVNSVQRLDNLKIFFVFFIFLYGCFYRSKMFLITHIYVVKQRTLSWQKGATNFKTFCMPILTLLLLDWSIKRHILFHLNYKTNFCTVTEIAHT